MECSGDGNFFDDVFWFYDPANQNSGQQSDNWHEQVVGEEVEEIENLIAENRDFAPDAITQRGRQCHQQGNAHDQQANRLPFPLQLVLQYGNNRFH